MAVKFSFYENHSVLGWQSFSNVASLANMFRYYSITNNDENGYTKVFSSGGVYDLIYKFQGENLTYDDTVSYPKITGGTITSVTISSKIHYTGDKAKVMKITGLDIDGADISNGSADLDYYAAQLLFLSDGIRYTGTTEIDYEYWRPFAYTNNIPQEYLDNVMGGDDVIRLPGQKGGRNNWETGDGNDKIFGGKSNDYFYGGNGNDKLIGLGNNDYLYGGNGRDIIKGGNGSDRLYGDNGQDQIYGGKDTDYIYGGAGDDTLTGGEGVDYFYFEIETNGTGDDVITDYVVGEDRLAIQTDTPEDITLTDTGDDVVIEWEDNSVTILGVDNPDDVNYWTYGGG